MQRIETNLNIFERVYSSLITAVGEQLKLRSRLDAASGYNRSFRNNRAESPLSGDQNFRHARLVGDDGACARLDWNDIEDRKRDEDRQQWPARPVHGDHCTHDSSGTL